MLSTILFGIVTPKSELIQAQRYCEILLTTRNDVPSATLLHPVFNNLELINFGLIQNRKISLLVTTTEKRNEKFFSQRKEQKSFVLGKEYTYL